MDRLNDALRAWLDFRASGDGDASAFLARHEDLRDLIEPLMGDAATAAGAVAAAGADGEDWTGVDLGDFRLLREIGRGGMGVVYQARQMSLDREVAVKILPGWMSRAPRSIARFRREAMTAARLRHPGLIDVFAVGESHGTQWFAMERIHGQPLDEYAATVRRERPLELVRTICELCAAVAEALEHSHRAGVVHRDIKPPNILVRGDGTPVLTDFGLARADELPSMTRTDEFFGTPHYVSPEQVARAAAVDHRTDVFSLGVTLYELLTRRRPFDGATTQAVLHEIVTREPRDPRRVDPAIPRDLAAIVLKALEKRREDRYPSAAAFADDLRRFVGFRPVSAKALSRPRRLLRWARREPIKAAVAGVLGTAALSVLGLGSYVLSMRDATERGQSALLRDRTDELWVEARLALQRNDMPTASALLTDALEIGGDDPVTVGAVAMAYASCGSRSNPKPVERALGVLAARPRLVASCPSLRRVRAYALETMGRVDEAAAEYGRLGPPRTALDHHVAAARAVDRSLAGDHDAEQEARQHMLAAVLKSRTPRLVFHFGLNSVCDQRQVWIEEASSEALVYLWPDTVLTWGMYGLTWVGREPERVARATARMEQIDPDNHLTHFLRGQAADLAGALDEAIRHYRRAVARNANDVAAVWGLASALERTGAIEQALAVIAEGAGRFSISAALTAMHGRLLITAGRAREAIALLTPAVERFPRDAECLAQLGSALRLTGEEGRARATLQRALAQLDPAHPDSAELRRGIEAELAALAPRGEGRRDRAP